MKKLFALMLAVSAFTFSACAGFFADPVAAHNGLVDRMDAILDAEETFYDAYYVIEEGDSVNDLSSSYDAFEASYADLEAYMADTTFSSGQEIFVQQYNELYSPALKQYIETAGEFVDVVNKDGFTYEGTETYIDLIDEQGYGFIDVHNSFIDTINLQADY